MTSRARTKPLRARARAKARAKRAAVGRVTAEGSRAAIVGGSRVSEIRCFDTRKDVILAI